MTGTMKRRNRDLGLCLSAVAALLIAVSIAGTAAAACPFNTADGTSALNNVTTGCDDSAFGFQALLNDTTGGENTAVGVNALVGGSSNPVTGSSNTAVGMSALNSDSTGSDNTATGRLALSGSGPVTGSGNTATGYQTLLNETAGNFNTATGFDALLDNTTGSNNLALGFKAGQNLTTGSNNIDIGNAGATGESDTIRIGTDGAQKNTYIAGIFDTNIFSGCDVAVEPHGLLGCAYSSARYKRDIHDMGRSSEGLMKLRPVTFRYKDDPNGIRQYGLIAEEVERVYPELVVRGADGKVASVRYSTLTSMLLNELEKQASENARQAEKVRNLSRQVAELKADRDRDRAQRAAFEARLSALEQTTQARNGGRKLAAAFDH